jgi:hypothetical protein
VNGFSVAGVWSAAENIFPTSLTPLDCDSFPEIQWISDYITHSGDVDKVRLIMI